MAGCLSRIHTSKQISEGEFRKEFQDELSTLLFARQNFTGLGLKTGDRVPRPHDGGKCEVAVVAAISKRNATLLPIPQTAWKELSAGCRLFRQS